MIINIKMFLTEIIKKFKFQMIVDIEWGAFGDNGVLSFLKTEWDTTVDKKSLLVASFT